MRRNSCWTALLVCASLSGLHGATISWTSSSDGLWTVGSNWSAGRMPTNSDQVVIGIDGIHVLLNTNVTVASLTVGGAGGQRTLVISNASLTLLGDSTIASHGLLRFAGGSLSGAGNLTVAADGRIDWFAGQMSGTGRTVIDPGATLAIVATNTDARLSGRTLDNGGSVLWQAGQITTDGGTVISNRSGATFDAQFDGIFAGTRVLHNAGTFLKSGGSNTLTVSDTFHNLAGGMVDVQSGTLSLSGGGRHSGKFQVGNGASLAFVGVATNTHTFLPASAVVGGGRVSFAGIGTVTIDVNGSFAITNSTTFGAGSTVNFNPSQSLPLYLGQTINCNGGVASLNSGFGSLTTSNLNLLGGTLGGTNAVTVTGRMTWNNSTLSNAAPLDVLGELRLNGNVWLDGRTLNLHSNSLWIAGTVFAGGGATINNLSNASFTLGFSGSISNTIPGPVAFNNLGAITKSGGTNVGYLATAFTNGGSLRLLAGTAHFAGPFIQTNGVTALLGGHLGGEQGMLIQAGRLEGAGSIDGNLTNAGVIDFTNRPGPLTVTGNFSQMPAGRIQVSLPAFKTNTNSIQVSASADLAGAVDVSLTVTNLIPYANGSYVLINPTSRSGRISDFNYPSNVNLVGLDLQQAGLTKVFLNVTNVPPVFGAIPATNFLEGFLSTYNLSNFVSDADLPPDKLTFELLSVSVNGGPAALPVTVVPADALNPDTGLFSWMPTEPQGSNLFTFTVRVFDDGTTVSTNLTAFQTFDITVLEVNDAPRLMLPFASTNVFEQTTFSITLTNFASDSDDPPNPLSFLLLSATNLSTGAPIAATNFNILNGLLTWTPDEADGPSSNEFSVAIWDINLLDPLASSLTNRYSFRVVVLESNLPPVFSNVPPGTVYEGYPFSLRLSNYVSDPDIPANNLTFQLVSVSSNNIPIALDSVVPTDALNTNTGVFSWTPSEAQGTNFFRFMASVSDGSLDVTQSFDVTVLESNRPPVCLPLPNFTSVEEQAFSVALADYVFDPDLTTNRLTFTLLTATNTAGTMNVAGGITVDPASGVLNWTPHETNGPGTFDITFRVTDFNTNAFLASNRQLTNDCTFHVLVLESNSPPQLLSGGPLTAAEQTSLIYSIPHNDRDYPTNTLTFTLLSASNTAATLDISGAITVNPTNGILTWTPDETNGPGAYLITLRLTDDNPGDPNPLRRNLSATNTLAITVTESNQAPIWTGTLNTNVAENSSWTNDLSVLAYDADFPANPLTFSTVGTWPPNVILSAAGLLVASPSEAQGPTNWNLMVRVTDTNALALANRQLSAITNIVINVLESNSPPVWQPVPAVSFAINISSSNNLSTYANDPDIPTNNLTFELIAVISRDALMTNITNLVTFQSTNGVLSWKPTTNDGPMIYDATISVTDANPFDAANPALTATTNFVIVVKNTNVPPVSILSTNGMPYFTNNGVALLTTTNRIDERTPFILHISASDTDFGANNLSLVVTNAPDGMCLSNVSVPTLCSPNLSGARIPGTNSAGSGGNITSILEADLVWTPTEAQGSNTFILGLLLIDDGTPPLTNVTVLRVVVNEVNNFQPVFTFPVNGGTYKTEVSPSSLTLRSTDDDIYANKPAPVFTLVGFGGNDDNFTASISGSTFSWDHLSKGMTETITNRVSDNGVPARFTTNIFVLYRYLDSDTKNSAPSFTYPAAGARFSVKTNQPLTIATIVFDADVPPDPKTYSMTSGPAQAAINSTNGIFTWTPAATNSGANAVTLRVSDGTAFGTVSFIITVRTNESVPPYFTLTNNSFTFYEHATNNAASLAATDDDLPGDTLTWSIVSAPDTNILINPADGMLTWVPSASDGPASYDVTVRVTDESMSFAETNITIVVREVNTAPVFLTPTNGAIYSVLTNTAFSIMILAQDLDVPATNGVNIGLMPNSPAGAVLGSTPGPGSAQATLSWTNPGVIGPTNFQLRTWDTNTLVSTNISLTNILNFTVVVRGSNRFAPVLSVLTNSIPIRELQTATVTNVFTTDMDVPSNILTYTLTATNLATLIPINNIQINPASGVIIWTPGEDQGPTTNIIWVTVTDDGFPAMAAVTNFTIIVLETNSPPVIDFGNLTDIAGIPNVFLNEGDTLRTTNSPATDEDIPETLLYNVTIMRVGNPVPESNVTTNPADGTFSWTPSEAQGPGVYSVIVQVMDAAGARDSNSFMVTVLEVNSPPRLTFPTNGLAVSNSIGYAMSIGAITSDPDMPANSLSYMLSSMPAGASFDMSSGLFAWVPTTNDIGLTNFTLTVNDNVMPTPLTDTASFSVKVEPRVASIAVATNVASLVVELKTGLGYNFQANTNGIAGPNWFNVQSFTGTANPTLLMHTNVGSPFIFYRVLLSP